MGNTAAASKPVPVDTNHCDPCYIIEKKTVGSSFICRECRHQLCDACFIHHQKVISTRRHKVLPLQLRESKQLQVSGRQAGSSDTGSLLQARGRTHKSTNTSAATKVSDRKPGYTGTKVILQVSGRKANYDSQGPVSQVSGRKVGSTDTTSVVQMKGIKSKEKEHTYTGHSDTAEQKKDGKRVHVEDKTTGGENIDQDQATGGDSEDPDQTVSSMKNMSLDPETSNIQTTTQTGKPYTSITLIHSLNIQRENDERNCVITGLVVLKDKLIVCDHNNNKLKVYDPSYRFLFDYKCDNLPYDIAILDINTVVVSYPLGHNMRLLSVGNDSMKEISKINTKYRCYGVCCYEGDIYCVVKNYRYDKVQVYTRSGKLQHTYEHFSDGKIECNYLDYITVNPQTGILYVTDWLRGVLVLSTNGDVIAIMSPSQFYWPRGIAVDDNRHIYVCRYGSYNVIQIRNDGHYAVKMLSGKNMCRWPQCVKIYENKMFVSHYSPLSDIFDDTISIYQLSTIIK